jgi:hypothetical protein
VVNLLPLQNDLVFQSANCEVEAFYSISPNPARSLLRVAVRDVFTNSSIDRTAAAGGQEAGITIIKVFDLRGNLRLQQRYGKSRNATLNISGLSTGVYLVEVSDEKRTERQKLVVVK